MSVLSSEASAPASGRDRALVQQLLAGDEAAFTSIVERYHGSLLRFARLFVRSASDAEEVVQDTWIAVLEGLPSFEGRAALKTWIFGILANRAKSRAVRETRMILFADLSAPGTGAAPSVEPRRFTPDGAWATPPVQRHEDTPEALLLHGETLAVVEQAMAALPSAQRAVVTLRDVEGLGATEVCHILEISETNQRVLLHRARSRLRAALERYRAGA